MDEERMIVGIIAAICVSIVVLTLGCITYYGKMPWYGSLAIAAIGYPSIVFMIWGDNVTNIIETILGFFKKEKKE